MVDKIEVMKRLKGSFIVDALTIRKLQSHISDSLKSPVKVTVRFSNNRTLSTTDLDAILSDSSVSNFAVDSIDFNAAQLKGESYVVVRLGHSDAVAVVMEITGDRRLALSLEDSLSNELNGVKSILGFLNTQQWAGVSVSLAINIIILFMAGAWWASYVWHAWIYENIPGWIGLAAAVPSAVLAIVGPYIAPPVVFNFGKGARSHTRRRHVLNFVFGSLIVAAIVNVVSGKINL